MITFLACAHMLDAMQLVWGVGGDHKNRGNNVLNPRIWDCVYQSTKTIEQCPGEEKQRFASYTTLLKRHKISL